MDTHALRELATLHKQYDNSDTVFLADARRKVFRLQNRVIKFGSNVTKYEADALRFVRQNTTVPVPEVYADFVTHDGNQVIVMEYIEGTLLSESWSTLSHEDKLGMCAQLRAILQQLRGFEGKYIGGIGDTSAIDSRKFTFTGGPFATEELFNDFLRSDLIPAAKRKLASTFQRSMSAKHKIFFTHGDLNLRNIIIHNGQIKALLDWEHSGWYPEYWEYVKFFRAVDDCDYIDNIFPRAYSQELVNDILLGQLLRH